MTKKEYAYSVLELKAIDEDDGIIEGIASTPTTDRVGDVVEPDGAQFKLPLPLLWHHDARNPIGHVLSAKVTKDGIQIRAKVFKDLLPRIADAWKEIKSGLVRGLSIGFRGLESADIKGTWGVRFIKWEWLELSAVTIPANMDATMNVVKSIDQNYRGAASGALTSKAVRLSSSPGVSGNTPPTSSKGQAMKLTVKEQISAMEAERAAKVARMTAIMEKSSEEARTLEEAESEEYDGLEAEVKSIDQHLVRLRAHQKMIEQSAQPVTSSKSIDLPTSQGGQQARGSIQFSKSNLPKGTGFTRLAMAIAASKGSTSDALLYVKQFTDTPEVELALKAAVAAGTTSDANWAAPLVNYTDLASEFIELLRPATIVGRLEGLRRVPFNIRMAKTASGSSVGWVGQGVPKPVSAMDFDTVSMTWAKIAGIVVLTEELVRFSSPSAEAIVRQDMIDAIAAFKDAQFIDPTVAAVANVNPASITNGISATTSTGVTLAAVEADLNTMLNSLATGEINPAGATWIMRPRTALFIGSIRDANGNYAFPGLGMAGGTLKGFPVITSNSVPMDTGTSTFIVLVVPSQIFLADDGAVRLDSSNQASLQMESAPVQGAATMVSLWQHNMVGIRAELFCNWQRRRDAAVAVLSDVSY